MLLSPPDQLESLLDLLGNSDETLDVKGAHPEVIARLAPVLSEFASGSRRKEASVDAVVDEETRADLRALGYLD